MKHTYKERRTISASKIISICIAHDWYTNGTCREYDAMLDSASSKENLTTEDIAEIARDILEHSDSERIMRSCGMEYEEVLRSVMFEIANGAMVFIDEE